MPIGISPLVDYAFKMLLGNEQNINLLIHFLNGMLVGQPRIVHARILNPAQLKQTADDKLSILDISGPGFCATLTRSQSKTSCVCFPTPNSSKPQRCST